MSTAEDVYGKATRGNGYEMVGETKLAMMGEKETHREIVLEISRNGSWEGRENYGNYKGNIVLTG